MKIAMVFDNAIPGGISTIGINYLTIFSKNKHEVDCFVLGKKDERILEKMRNISNRVYEHKFSQYVCPDFYWKVCERIWTGKYMFPILYLFFSLLLILLKPFKARIRKYDITIAFSGHTNDLTFVAKHFVRGAKKIAWLHGSQSGYYLNSIGFAYLYKRIHNLVVLSNYGDFECDGIKKRFNLNVQRIYNPFISDEKATDSLEVKKLKSVYGDYLLSVGRLSQDKDPETIIKAYSIMKKRFGLTNKLVICGDGEKRHTLAKMINEFALENDVFLVGNQSKIVNYYMGATLFIHSSPLEGLPTTLIESLHYGVPIIASDSVPGVREVLDGDKYGMIFKCGDYTELAELTVSLLKDSKKRESLSKEGKLRAKVFSEENIGLEFNKFIESLE